MCGFYQHIRFLVICTSFWTIFEAEFALSETPQKKKSWFCAQGCICWLSVLSTTPILDALLKETHRLIPDFQESRGVSHATQPPPWSCAVYSCTDPRYLAKWSMWKKRHPCGSCCCSGFLARMAAEVHISIRGAIRLETVVSHTMWRMRENNFSRVFGEGCWVF